MTLASLFRAGMALAMVAASIALTAMLGQAQAIAQSSSASYQIPRQSIDGGAARARSAGYTIEGTIGQPDAAPPAASASYELRGGFHRAAAGALPDPLFANGFE
ncbi:MAG: hypothetical protein IPK27_19050 [Rhodanobacteraceae bacterium]|nr:hypothetical protein [Rhodanobacteraceae bacterium]